MKVETKPAIAFAEVVQQPLSFSPMFCYLSVTY